jgi:uncharacterized protein YecE (DUF72 family)
MDFSREMLARGVAALAARGLYVGTSSWKYEGWLDLIYTPDRYRTRGRLSRAKFDRHCLAEYTEIFKTVCLDAGFYQFPTAKMFDGIFSQVPADFLLSTKVTEDITVKRYPELPRYSSRAGKVNEHFLDADLFIGSFLGPLEPYRERLGTLFLEFSHFHPGDWELGRQFVEALDVFLGRLPKGWNYSVEVRNPSLLQPEYFQMLRSHGVAHAFNNWTRMPPVAEQLQMPGSSTADFDAARFLLKPGRSYEQAVEKFQPYREVRELDPEARWALIRLLTTPPEPEGGRPRRRFLYVNNRLEGCSLLTIYAVITELMGKHGFPVPPLPEKEAAALPTEIAPNSTLPLL